MMPVLPPVPVLSGIVAVLLMLMPPVGEEMMSVLPPVPVVRGATMVLLLRVLVFLVLVDVS